MAKVLVVEDDQTVASMIQDWLIHQKHLAEAALTAREAQDKLLVCKYDLLILDWQLPDGTGLQILKEFRDRGGNTPALMLTAKNELPDKELGFDAGADDYLTKPFHMRELAARIAALLRRPPSFFGKTLQAQDIKLNTATHQVTKGGKEIHLNPKEYALLEFFLLHPNRIFSPEALMERIWVSESESSTNAVIVTMKRLRQKLDDPESDSSIIKTVRASGYMLEINS